MLKVKFAITPSYPASSPSVALEPNKIWHTNVNFSNGGVCVTILNSDWNELKDKSLLYIVDNILPAFIVQQNPNDPLNSECKAQSKAEQKYKAMRLLRSQQLTLDKLGAEFDYIPEYTKQMYSSISQTSRPVVFGHKIGQGSPRSAGVSGAS